MKPVITLISDWHVRDPYLSMFKGQLLSELPDAVLLDITHLVNFHDLAQTAFLMKQSYLSFPDNSIHLLLTNVTFSSDFNPVVFKQNGHFFIGEDKGVFSMMFEKGERIFGRRYVGEEMPSLKKMVLLAKYIIENVLDEHTEDSGPLVSTIMQSAFNNVLERRIEGKVVYIDSHFNALTNISIELFREFVKGENVNAEVFTDKSSWKVNKCYSKYGNDGEFFFIENAIGCMEIAISQGKIAALANIKVNDLVIINY